MPVEKKVKKVLVLTFPNISKWMGIKLQELRNFVQDVVKAYTWQYTKTDTPVASVD